jgi:antibiotic biosynthesis monooxygenase (ABM) superfamily enzyme
MDDQVDAENPRPPRRWLVAVVTTVTAWSVAFLVVMALLTLFREQLASLPVALRALVISGVLVTLMVNLLMPVLGGAVARMLAGGTRPRFAPGPGEPGARRRQPIGAPSQPTRGPRR